MGQPRPGRRLPGPPVHEDARGDAGHAPGAAEVRPRSRRASREGPRVIAAEKIPTLDDVRAARRRIAPHLQPTPLYLHSALTELVGTEVFVKHENHLPTGAFKVRGGINLVSQLSEDERRRGVVTASTGNHGQSIAFAAGRFGMRAIVCVPDGANPVKLAAMKRLGAKLVVHGRDFDDAREHCEALAGEHGYRYIHSGNEPHLIAGVGTATLELLETEPEVDPPGARGDRRAVLGGARGLPLVAGAAAARGPDGDARRRSRNPRRVRAPAANPLGAPRRLRPRRRGRAGPSRPPDDRGDAQPRR